MVKKLYPENWVRHYRSEAGLTAQDLGDKIGMTKEGITKIERREGGLTLDNAKKIAAALDVHYWDIIDGPAAPVLVESEEEIEMLKKFRQMDEKDQDRFIHMAEMFAMENEKKKS